MRCSGREADLPMKGYKLRNKPKIFISKPGKFDRGVFMCVTSKHFFFHLFILVGG